MGARPKMIMLSVPASQRWRSVRRFVFMLTAFVPGAVFASWVLVQLTGSGAFWWLAPVMTFGVIPVLDHVVGSRPSNPSAATSDRLDGDPLYRWATYLYLPAQYLSLIFACWLWSGGGWLVMNVVDKAGLTVTVGIIGGIAINAAHELGHKTSRAERRASKVALAQTCYGHFYVEHNRGHHKRVATVEDPATSRFGESLYRFVPRSLVGSLRSAWALESRRWARAGRTRWNPRNDVLNAWALTAGLYVVLVVWFGPVVLPWLVAQAVVGVGLLETVNYLEHYGLRRQRLANGRYESVSPEHSWNSDTLVANLLLFHLQRHSDHHVNPARRYQTLRTRAEAPQLPAGYGTMVLLALVPPLWRRVMDPRVLAHYDNDIRRVGLSPRAALRVGA